MSLELVAMLMLGNLRGLRESTKVFGVPVQGATMLILVLARKGRVGGISYGWPRLSRAIGSCRASA